MKKWFSFLTCTCLYFSVSAQWSTVLSNPGFTFRDIQFVTDSLGFILANSDSGYAVLLKTTDAGAVWKQDSLPLPFADKLFWFDDSSGYIIKGGAPVVLLKTTDEGSSWTSYGLDSSFIVTGLHFVNRETGYYMNNAGRLRKILYGGSSYKYLYDTLPDSGPIEFPDSLTGYIPQDSYVFTTTDGGLSWEALPTGLPVGIFSPGFAFSSASTGYLSTWNTTGPNIYRTTDYANHWYPSGLRNATVLDAAPGVCLASGYDSLTVLLTTDDGLTWTQDVPPAGYTGAIAGELTPGLHAWIIAQNDVYKRTASIAVQNPEAEVNSAVSVWPNPGSSLLHLNHVADRLDLISASGTPVFSCSFCSEADVSTLPAGIYIGSVQNGRRTEIFRFIRE